MEAMDINMEITIVVGVITNTIVITTQVDSRESMEFTEEMDILAIVITMDSSP